MKTPFEVLHQPAKEQIERDRKSVEFFFDYTDKYIIWLIGFSVGGISLIIGNYSTVETKFLNNTKAIIFFLSLTIVLGLLYRIVIYLYFSLVKNVETYLYAAFGDVDMMAIKDEKENIDTKKIQEIIDDLEFDFGEKVDHLKNLTVIQENELRSLYKHRSKLSRESFKIAVENIATSYFVAYRIPKEKTIAELTAAFGLGDNLSHLRLRSKIGFNAKFWSIIARL